jgi:hypothetical protein
MKKIELTKGYHAKVDDDDFDRISKSSWYLHSMTKKSKLVYASRKLPNYGKDVSMHRIIMEAEKGQHVDHINGDGLDNRKENLRLCCHSENLRNRGKNVNNTSGFKGVVKQKNGKPWSAEITVNYKHIHLGTFKTKIEAAKAYNVAALKYHGEFARLNVIPK